MAKKDGVVRIGFDYKKELEEVCSIIEKELNGIGSDVNLSDSIKDQIGELKTAISNMQKEINSSFDKINNTKLDSKTFKSFKNDIEQQLKIVNNEIVSLKNQLSGIGNVSGVNDISNQFKTLETNINNSSKALAEFVKKNDVATISDFSQSSVNIDSLKKNRSEINKLLREVKEEDFGYENQNVQQLENSLNELVDKYYNLKDVISSTSNTLKEMDKNSIDYKEQSYGLTKLSLEYLKCQQAIEEISALDTDNNINWDSIFSEEELDRVSNYIDNKSKNIISRAEKTIKDIDKLIVSQNSLDSKTRIDSDNSLKPDTTNKEKRHINDVENAVDSLTKALGEEKVDAINKEVETMQNASIKEMNSIMDVTDTVIDLKDEIASIKTIDTPKIEVDKLDNNNVNSSSNNIQKEADAFKEIADKAKIAAEAKEQFASANKKVKTTAESSSSVLKKEKKNISEETINWDENIKVIQKYMNAVTKLNNLRASNLKTNNKNNQIKVQEEQVEKLRKEAEKARMAINSVVNPHNASPETWKEWVNSMELFHQATRGSEESIAKIADALKTASDSQRLFIENQISNFRGIYDKYNVSDGYVQTKELKNNLTKLNNEINNLQSSYDELKNEKIINEKDIKNINNLILDTQKLSDSIKNMPASDRGSFTNSIDKLKNKVVDYMNNNTSAAKKFEKEFKKILNDLGRLDNFDGIKKIEDDFLKLRINIAQAGDEGKRFFDIVKDKAFYGAAGVIGTYFGIEDVIYGIQRGIETVRELDTAMTEMRKVSDESISSLKRYQEATFDIGDTVGATGLTIQNSTAEWMRLGEALDDASESARVSNILLNVSEFDSIDEATESLVAMSQAYTDLDKIDIVDKLNNVGNKFSISTDGLAEALQRSASALTTAGNDLDEAIALATAGNAVVQDPESVGAGIRTISLRLVGTKQAKQELEDLGEDTSDFIETQSKLRDIILEATKAATSNHQGFDILDDNGNYKSTYEILQGLADLYDEIAAKDKELGTNNLNLLLETIAGKQRSNIAASILQNADMLRGVYEESQNSAGSAQEELDKYLDSIDGRMEQLTNRAQEFWYTFIDSETVKNGITLLSQLLSILTKIVDTIGPLGAISGLAGGILGAKGLGLTNYVTSYIVYKPLFRKQYNNAILPT